MVIYLICFKLLLPSCACTYTIHFPEFILPYSRQTKFKTKSVLSRCIKLYVIFVSRYHEKYKTECRKSTKIPEENLRRLEYQASSVLCSYALI